MLNALDVINGTLEKTRSVPEFWNDFLFNDILKPHTLPQTYHWPAVDVREMKDRFVIVADLPGMEEKDIQIKIENGSLVIEGERKLEEDLKEGNFIKKERFHTSFKKSFELGEGINAEKVEAQYKNGVLRIQLPKHEKILPKVIPISIQTK